MSSFAISAQHLARSFGDTHALIDVSLDVPAGSVCALLGRNGAGKTTTVRILTTLLDPDGGHARVAGFDIATQANKVRGRIGDRTDRHHGRAADRTREPRDHRAFLAPRRCALAEAG